MYHLTKHLSFTRITCTTLVLGQFSLLLPGANVTNDNTMRQQSIGFRIVHALVTSATSEAMVLYSDERQTYVSHVKTQGTPLLVCPPLLVIQYWRSKML